MCFFSSFQVYDKIGMRYIFSLTWVSIILLRFCNLRLNLIPGEQMLMYTLHKLIGNNVLIIQKFECSQSLNVYRKEKDAIFFSENNS